MHDLLMQLLRYARGTWRYRWWMLGVAWAVCIVGWVFVARMPDQFKASARVYVDTTSVLRPYLRGLTLDTGDTDRKVFLMTRTLLSQPNLEKVLRMTDLDLRATTSAQKDALIKAIRSKLKFSGTNRENLYTISYVDSSPQLAKLVVKSLLTIFMEGNLGDVRQDQDSARRFIQNQVDEYDRQIVKTEEQLLRFKQKHHDLLSGDKDGYYSRLSDLQQAKQKAQLALSVAEDQLKAISQQMDGETPSFGLGPTSSLAATAQIDTSSFDTRIEALQRKLDDMLLTYTDKYPDVITAREAIRNLKLERRRYIQKARKALASGSPDEAPAGFEMDQNPVYQQMQITRAKLEADAVAQRRMLADYTERLKKLESSAGKAFELQSTQQQMMRVIQRTKATRSVLVARLESADLSRRADNSSDAVRFRVIDPPRVPTEPSGPNRVLLSSAVLGAGLILGLGLAFLMSQFRPTFDDRQMTADALGIPVLGSVNMVWTSDQVRARKVRNVSFLFSLTGLLVAFALVLAMYQFHIDLLPRLARSLNMG